MEPYNPQSMELEILQYWNEKRIYQETKQKNKGRKRYFFLDGPPYTSGKVHIGTAWNKALKDMVLRFKRMQGFDVWDRAGYDMHGLPIEHRVCAKLNVERKSEIVQYGLAKFMEQCKKFALESMDSMNKDFLRMGVWMDFENPFYPIKTAAIEGEWWLIKKADEAGRLYKGERAMSWCASCGTALAKHELEYKTIADNSIYIKFKVKNKENEYLIVWTTTPWTIAYDLAIMANPEMDYVKCTVNNEEWILAKERAAPLIEGILGKSLSVTNRLKGSELEGLSYIHPWSEEIAEFRTITSEKLHTVVMSSEHVTATDGTGLVHCAPGCGPEDYEVGHRNGLPPFNNIDQHGFLPKTMGKFGSLRAKTDDKSFIEYIDQSGSLIHTERIEHEYAHCDRCHNPIVFKSTKQWFFKVEDLIPKMREANSKIRWVPEWAGAKQFDSWLENLRDNSITKQRFWGTPVPIWECNKCEKFEVIATVKELQIKAGSLPEDLHIPWIDELVWKCSCGGTKRRIPDVLDVWVDAGVVAWTSLDYPQKTELFKQLFPAEFILEGKDQIRGWFNLLMVCSMITFQEAPFKNVYMHGFVQDSLGRKMSKSLGNYILPEEVIEKYGADTLRYYMIGGANPAIDINYNFDDMKLKHKNLMILWNLTNFVIEFCKDNDCNPLSSGLEPSGIEEKYMLSRLHSTIEKVTSLFNEYRLNEVPLVVESLFLDLSRVYVQMTREKASMGSKKEKTQVAYTVAVTLFESLKLLAPVAPFISEKLYLELKEAFNLFPASVHLYPWPQADKKQISPQIEKDILVMQEILGAVHHGREKINRGLRWPLFELIVVSKDENVESSVQRMKDILAEQANVTSITFEKATTKQEIKLKADYAKIGPEFGDAAPAIIAQLATQSPASILTHIKDQGHFLVKVGNDNYKITEKHLVKETQVSEPYHATEFPNGLVLLNKTITPELEREGLFREFCRRVQALRKKAGMAKGDLIGLYIETDQKTQEDLAKFSDQIKEKCGAIQLHFKSPRECPHIAEEKVKQYTFTVGIIYAEKKM